MVDTAAESIIAEVSGLESTRILFEGKNVGLERVLRLRHAYGEIIIDSMVGTSGSAKERTITPFENDNIYAKKKDSNGKAEVCLSPVAISPVLCIRTKPLLLTRG
jgi:DUF917 family protein